MTRRYGDFPETLTIQTEKVGEKKLQFAGDVLKLWENSCCEHVCSLEDQLGISRSYSPFQFGAQGQRIGGDPIMQDAWCVKGSGCYSELAGTPQD